ERDAVARLNYYRVAGPLQRFVRQPLPSTAPAFTSNSLISGLPRAAARGLYLFGFGSAPESRRSRTTATSPHPQAAYRGPGEDAGCGFGSAPCLSSSLTVATESLWMALVNSSLGFLDWPKPPRCRNRRTRSTSPRLTAESKSTAAPCSISSAAIRLH